MADPFCPRGLPEPFACPLTLWAGDPHHVLTVVGVPHGHESRAPGDHIDRFGPLERLPGFRPGQAFQGAEAVDVIAWGSRFVAVGDTNDGQNVVWISGPQS